MTARNNRFTDPTPFTPMSSLPPEVQEWHRKVIAAKARYRQTNDPTELIELGVLPKLKDGSEDTSVDRESKMELEASQITEIEQMYSEGSTIVQISNELSCSKQLVRKQVIILLGDKLREIEQLAGEGKTIGQIGKEVGLNWWQVREFVASWLGTKMSITRKLNRLAEESNQSKRECLVRQIAERVNYLYYSGIEMGKQIENARKALNG